MCTASNKIKKDCDGFIRPHDFCYLQKETPRKTCEIWSLNSQNDDDSSVKDSSERNNVCFGLFWLEILRETSSRHFFFAFGTASVHSVMGFLGENGGI